MQLYEDGQLLASDDEAWGTYTATTDHADYRLDLSVRRSTDVNWEYSTHTDTTWEFRSARPAAGTVELPLLQVDYDVPVGLDNEVPGGRLERLEFTVEAALRLADVDAWVSFDDGGSWQRLDLRDGHGSSWSTVVRHPAAGGQASLRVEATDRDGNSIDQTVLRAYSITPRS